MSYWEVNKKIIDERFPVVSERLAAVVAASEATWSQGTLEIQFQGNPVHPYGQIDADQLVGMWVRRNEPIRDGYNFVTGFGDGSHIRAAMKMLSSVGRLFVYEPDLTLLKTVLSSVDVSYVLQDSRFLLGAGPLDQNCFAALKNEVFEAEGDWKYMPYTPTQHLNPVAYVEARDLFGKELFLRKNIYRNRSDFAESFHGTRITNLPYTLCAPDVSDFRGRFSDVTFVLVAAGPSLDESYGFLRAIQDRALIACGNSSIEALLKNGITPHIVVAVDFRNDTLLGFKNVDTDRTVLFCSSYVNSEVLPSFDGRTVAWASEGDPLDVARQRLGRSKGAQIAGEGTLTTSMIQIAAILGCQKICLVAQDLGYPESGQRHVSTGFYEERGDNNIDVVELDAVPGNTRDQVYQDGHMRLYQRAVENRLEALEGIEAINVSVLGARIRHATYKSFSDAEMWMSAPESTDLFDRLSEGLDKQPDLQDRKRLLGITQQPLKVYAQKILDQALGLAFSIEALPDTASKPHYANNREVKDCLARSEKINASIAQHAADHGIIAEGRARPLLLEFAEIQKEVLSEVPHWDSLEKNLEFSWALAEGAYFILQTLQKMEAIADQMESESQVVAH